MKQRNIQVDDEVWVPFVKKILDLRAAGIKTGPSHRISELMIKDLQKEGGMNDKGREKHNA